MPKRSRATLKGLALAKLQRLNGAAYRGHPRKTDIGTPSCNGALPDPPRMADGARMETRMPSKRALAVLDTPPPERWASITR